MTTSSWAARAADVSGSVWIVRMNGARLIAPLRLPEA
jgi:hypothetical protein